MRERKYNKRTVVMMLEISLASVHHGEYIVRHADHFSWCGCGFLLWFAEIIL